MAILTQTNRFAAFMQRISVLRYTSGMYINGAWYNGDYIDARFAIIPVGQTLGISINGIPFVIDNVSGYDEMMTTLTSAVYTYFNGTITLQYVPGVGDINAATGALGLILVLGTTVEGVTIDSAYYTNPDESDGQILLSFAISPYYISASVCVQPLVGDQVLMLPDGLRDKSTYQMWSQTQLFPANPWSATTFSSPSSYSGQNADKAIVFGAYFDIYQTKSWQEVPNLSPSIGLYNYIISMWQPLLPLQVNTLPS